MKFYLRKAIINDADLLFEWVNDEAVRKSAFNSNIITYNEHIDWIRQKLYASNCIIFIGYIEEKPIGQIRIDIESEIASIDYSIDRRYRGKGYGIFLLEAVENDIYNSKLQVKEIVGRVKYTNLSSQRTFEKAGYTGKNEDKNICYFKKIESRK